MATIKPTTVPSKRLAESITASSTSIKLNNILGWDGVDLAASNFGTLLYAVLRNDAGTRLEIIELDASTIASASITINKRGLKFDGDLTTEVTANKLSWVKNETIVEIGTHAPQLFGSYLDLYSNQTVTGYKSVPTPISASHAVTKAYVDALALGGNGTTDRVIVSGTAGATISTGDLIYFDTTDNEWKLVDADSSPTLFNVLLGIAQGAGTDGNSITNGVLLSGFDSNQSGMTQGDLMYASNTAGDISSSTGTNELVIGIATSATELYFNPTFYYTPTFQQKAAMAGSSGTPSSSNKFVTELDTNYSQTTKGKLSFFAGESITGATLPVPVYQSKTNNHFYKADANDTAKYKFIGFAITDGLSANFTADAGTDFLTSVAHALQNGTTIRLTTTTTLPANLDATTTYYVINRTADTFQISLTEGGAAVDIGDAGTGTHTFHEEITIQFTGAVSGFSGLSEGEKYYLSDTVGTIGNTTGTQEILVGIAVSETQLLIQKGIMRANGSHTFGDNGATGATSDLTLTLGFRPSVIRMQGISIETGSNIREVPSYGNWVNGNHNSIYYADSTTSAADVGVSTSYILNNRSSGSENWRVTIQSVTDTGCVIRAEQRVDTPENLVIVYDIEGSL